MDQLLPTLLAAASDLAQPGPAIPLPVAIAGVVILGGAAAYMFLRSGQAPAKPAGPKSGTEPPPTTLRSAGVKDEPLQADETGATSASDGETSGRQARILVTAVGRTDPGLKRKHNEDAYLVLEEHSLFVVADGMGRHAAGEVASKLAVDTVREMFESKDFGEQPVNPAFGTSANHLLASFNRANEHILKQSQEVEAYHGMGTTMVALHFSRSRQEATIVHAGDSRCYRIRGDRLAQLTRDHTLGEAGIVGPSASVLSKAVGIEEKLDAEVNTDTPEMNDIYLICSDGLSRMVNNEEILKTIRSDEDLDKVCQNLIDAAHEGGGRDNVTVILVRVQEPDKPKA